MRWSSFFISRKMRLRCRLPSLRRRCALMAMHCLLMSPQKGFRRLRHPMLEALTPDTRSGFEQCARRIPTTATISGKVDASLDRRGVNEGIAKCHRLF